MKSYGFSLWLNDLVSSPLMKMSRMYDSTVGKFTAGAKKLGSLFRPASQSVDELRAKLDSLKANRQLMVDTRQIKAADREITALERKLEKLTGRDSKGRFLPSGKRPGDDSPGAEGRSKKKDGGFIDGIKSAVRGGLMTYGALMLGGGVSGVLGGGMSAESTKLAYEQFAGAQAAPLYEALNKFANETPFTNEQILQGGRTMLPAYRPDQIPWMQGIIGNISAGANKDFGELTAAVTKIKMKDFVDSGELHQEFGGTPLMEVLKKQMGGISGDELFKMAEGKKIRYADLEKALVSMSTGDGMFAGMMDKISKTAEGKMSTFTGTLQYKLQQAAEKLNPFLGKLFDFGTAFLEGFDPVGEALMRLVYAFSPLWDSVSGLMELLGLTGEKGSALTNILNGLAGIVDILATAVGVATSPVGQLVLLFAGLFKGVMLLSTVGIAALEAGLTKLWALMLANPITAILAALLAVGTAIKYAWDNVTAFREAILKLWEVSKSVFSRLGGILKAFFTLNYADLVAQIAAAWTEGTANGNSKITADRKERLNERRQERRNRLSIAGSNNPFNKTPFGATPTGGGSGEKSKVESGVTGAKSNTININVSKLVEKMEIHTTTFNESIEDLEEKIVDALIRVIGSATAAAN